MLVLKESQIKEGTIPGHIHWRQTTTKHMKYKVGIPTVMVHVEQINQTTTLCITIEEELNPATEEDNDLR